MNSYLGIDHHRLGPPPNWRNYRKGLFGLRFDRERYIHDVEMYIQKTHTWHFNVDITDYDNFSAEVGEDACDVERMLNNVLKIIGKHARGWDSVKDPEEVNERLADREDRYENACLERGLPYDVPTCE